MDDALDAAVVKVPAPATTLIGAVAKLQVARDTGEWSKESAAGRLSLACLADLERLTGWAS